MAKRKNKFEKKKVSTKFYRIARVNRFLPGFYSYRSSTLPELVQPPGRPVEGFNNYDLR
jgi:hypothetical protein